MGLTGFIIFVKNNLVSFGRVMFKGIYIIPNYLLNIIRPGLIIIGKNNAEYVNADNTFSSDF